MCAQSKESQFWQTIQALKPCFRLGASVSVGRGTDTLFGLIVGLEHGLYRNNSHHSSLSQTNLQSRRPQRSKRRPVRCHSEDPLVPVSPHSGYCSQMSLWPLAFRTGAMSRLGALTPLLLFLRSPYMIDWRRVGDQKSYQIFGRRNSRQK